ncbi:hypothetical protein QTN25_001455 [Entamoeba marina]
MNVTRPIAHHIYYDSIDVYIDESDSNDDCMSEDVDIFHHSSHTILNHIYFDTNIPPRDINPVQTVLSAPTIEFEQYSLIDANNHSTHLPNTLLYSNEDFGVFPMCDE